MTAYFFSQSLLFTQYDRLLASSCRPSVRPSVCLPVCNAVHCGFQGRCSGQKLYQRVLSRQDPICLFRHFCCRMYHLATKRREKGVEENRNMSFLRHVQKTCGLLAVENLRRSASRTSLFTLDGSLGAFIKSNRLNLIARLLDRQRFVLFIP